MFRFPYFGFPYGYPYYNYSNKYYYNKNIEKKEEKTVEYLTYRPTYVFDISQTVGEPMPLEDKRLQSNNMKELMINPLSRVYNIEKKDGNLKEIYTAKINAKIRMHIKPIGEYPYKLEEIIEVELIEIDEKHYGEG